MTTLPENHITDRLSSNEAYRTIGACLYTLEASTLRVGAPLLLPTPRVRKLIFKLHEPVDEHLKLMLVNVKSEALESYIDDMRSLPLNPTSNEILGLTSLSDFERFGVISVAIIAFCLLFAPLLSVPRTTIGWIGLAAVVFGIIVVWFLNLALGSEHYRRSTFIWYANKELSRRRGISSGRPMSALKAE